MKDNIFSDILFLDGAMGSLLLESVEDLPEPPEAINVTDPQIVIDIHNRYAASGSDAVYTNTFGVNRLKVGDRVSELINAGIDCALSSNATYVGLDIGPLGKIVGDSITFEEAYDLFAEIILAAKGREIDFIAIETMMDLGEVKAAILAAKENCDLPVIVSMTFDERGKSPFGVTPAAFAITAESLRVAAIGANCSVGPDKMYDIARELVTHTSRPVFIKANAGLPVITDGKVIYDITPDEYAAHIARIHRLGVNIFGGCCGTTPDFVAAMKAVISDTLRPAPIPQGAYLCSARRVVTVDHTITVGERINPTGKKRFQQALRNEELDYIIGEGVTQMENGAEILDVNLGLNGIDEQGLMRRIVDRLNLVTDAVIMADSSDPAVLECAVRRTPGKGVINSVNGSESSLDNVLPIAAKYGWAVIGLTLDEQGIPATVEGRVNIAKRIIERAAALGIPREDVYIDCLTMAEAGERGNAMLTLQSHKSIAALGCHTALGLSNVSFGMPRREELNRAFYRMAAEQGLTLAIINPSMLNGETSQQAYDFLLNRPNSAERYIAYADQSAVTVAPTREAPTIMSAILSGQKELAVRLTQETLGDLSPMDIVNGQIIPALDRAGELFEKGKYFLPQLIGCADSASAVFDILRSGLPTDNSDKGLLLLATVKGDIHEIGKNIVKAVVENYGYRVIDLGKDVDYDVIIQAIDDHYPCVLGLSALMTTTAENMAETIRRVRKKYPNIEILIGGAVITEEFAMVNGATYCHDAADTVKKMKAYYGN